MLHNNILHLCKFINHQVLSARFSALFINGLRATDTFTFLTPYIDFPERLAQKEVLLEDLKKRKSDYELQHVENLWSVYEELKKRQSELEGKKKQLSNELGKLIKVEPEGDNTKKYKIQHNLIKENIKKLKVPLWSAEEAAIVEALKLPNSLHGLTPESENKILYTHLTPPANNKDHLKIAKELNVIHFKKNENYYLKGDAAVFELGAKFYFNKILKYNQFVQFSNPDFVKSIIVEGCGQDHRNPDDTFILHHNEDSKVNIDSRLHLTGGGSLASFLAYYAKNVVIAKVLPMKYFSMGRQYIPAPSDEDSLFHVSQSSVVQLFGVTKDSQQSDEFLNSIIETMKAAYGNLGYHYRLSLLSADKLFMWESLRVIIEMYSSSLKSYVEVANVSVSGDFISKRLLFTYTDQKQAKFPYIISGTILNVPKLLGCILEQDQDFTVPEQFRIQNWKV